VEEDLFWVKGDRLGDGMNPIERLASENILENIDDGQRVVGKLAGQKFLNVGVDVRKFTNFEENNFLVFRGGWRRQAH
jgi:hypothetical protein